MGVWEFGSVGVSGPPYYFIVSCTSFGRSFQLMGFVLNKEMNRWFLGNPSTRYQPSERDGRNFQRPTLNIQLRTEEAPLREAGEDTRAPTLEKGDGLPPPSDLLTN